MRVRIMPGGLRRGRWDRIAEERTGTPQDRLAIREQKRLCAKIPYESKDVALGELDRRRAAYRAQGRDEYLRAYDCPRCGFWHLTSKVFGDGRTRRWDHLGPAQCYLCFQDVGRPYAKMLAAHRPVCPKRQIQRYCGICEKALPRDYPLHRKYHLGICDEEAEQRMVARMKLSAIGPSWPKDRIATIAALIDSRVHASYLSAETGLTFASLQSYAKLWRRRGFLAKRLVFSGAEPRLIVPRVRCDGPPAMYPFIRTTPTAEHDLVLLVHRAVPSTLPPDLRADVCQTALLQILEGHLRVEDLATAVPVIIRETRRELAPWAEVSFEAMRRSETTKGRENPVLEGALGYAEAEGWTWECRICLKPKTDPAEHDICEVIRGEQARTGHSRRDPRLFRLYIRAATEGHALASKRREIDHGMIAYGREWEPAHDSPR